MYLVPFVHRQSTLAGKTVHTLRILLEGDHLWCEEAVEAALEENGLVPKTLHIQTLDGKPCVLAPIDTTKTDITSMYSAEELEPTDKTTHRWVTVHLLFQNDQLWLPPPSDLAFAPLPPSTTHTLFVQLCKNEVS
jgi:hypothetical protein